MEGTLHFDVSAAFVGLALLVTLLGLFLLRLPRSVEYESMRAVGISLVFVCVLAVLGFFLFRNHYFAHPHGPLGRATDIHR